MLQAARPFIRPVHPDHKLISFFEQINTAFRTAPREANADTESLVKSPTALTRIVTQAADSLQRPGTPPSPNVIALFDTSGSGVLSKATSLLPMAGFFGNDPTAPTAKTNGPTVGTCRSSRRSANAG